MYNSLISQVLIFLIGFSGSYAHCIDDHGNVGEIHPLYTDCDSHACESSVHSCDTNQCEHNNCSDKQITSIQTIQRIRGAIITNDRFSHPFSFIQRNIFPSLIKNQVSFDSPQKYLHRQNLQVLRI